jgi:hypothetical protein
MKFCVQPLRQARKRYNLVYLSITTLININPMAIKPIIISLLIVLVFVCKSKVILLIQSS